MPDTHSSGAVTSVVGDILLVAVVIVLALTLSVTTADEDIEIDRATVDTP